MAEKKPDGTVKLDVKATAAAPKEAPKAAAPKAPATKVVGGASPVVAQGQIKKGDFIDQVVARSGLKRGDVKTALEAGFAELAEALMRGDDVNFPPMGKIKVMKDRPLSEGAHALTLKLRTMKAAPPEED